MYRWIITIAVVLLSLVIWKQVNPSKSAVEITLRNGSRFRVYELTFGTNVVLGKTTIWQKFLGHMPSKLQPASFRPPSVITLQTPSTVLVYDITRPDGQPSNPLNFSWVDENGFESSGNGSTAWSGLYGTNMVQARIFSSAPRRSKVIKLKILDSMRGPEAALQGEMVFQSQIQSQVPPWVAISLPQTQQVNAVTVRLMDAAYGME
ncbi:MAG: hypothetical protein JWN25_3424 [Verrucomicrobiales bacterium]|nr:hypothetical protein [Verrucomicrobiales bacterium]